MSQFNDIRSAFEGTYVYNTIGELELISDAYFVSADAVISRIEINSDTGTNVVGDYIDTAAAAVAAGTWLMPKRGDFFSAITLASGTVVAYTKKPIPS